MPESRRDAAVQNIILAFPHPPVIENDSIDSLYWYGKASGVLIHGDYQHGWDVPDTLESVPCGDSTFFHISYTLPFYARLDYQFQIDSLYVTDLRNPAITPNGYGLHSEIPMPGFKPDPVRLPRQDIPHGTIDSLLLISREHSILPRQARIYVPAGYESFSELPVLYVLDGLEAMEFMDYQNVLDNLIADRKICPIIVIFIPPQDRDGELLGYKKEAFVRTLCHNYVPFIDQIYKTSRQPCKRGITGISNGGFMALYILLNHPDVFLCGAGQSPTITGEIYKALNSLSPRVMSNSDLRFYFDVGRFDLSDGSLNGLSFFKACTDLHEKLNKEGVSHFFQVVNDGHEWANWRERADDILIYFFGAFH